MIKVRRAARWEATDTASITLGCGRRGADVRYELSDDYYGTRRVCQKGTKHLFVDFRLSTLITGK
jgi:hypothetical protein